MDGDDDDIERITVTLPTCFTGEVRASVVVGEYPSVDAVVEKAIGDWWADRAITRIGVDRLRRHLDDAVAEGGFRRLDVEDVLKRVRERAASLRKTAGTLAG